MRKSLTITIEDEGRDKGKVFHITELSAFQAEQWATRAFLALARSGVEIPDGIETAGFAGIAHLGIKALAKIQYEDAAPLLSEMLTCVSIIPDPARPSVMRSDIENDIEEVRTLIQLRREVLDLHMGFSTPVTASTLKPVTGSRPARSTKMSRAALVR
jgi:hypothetical protein